jgi:hypothetical protein
MSVKALEKDTSVFSISGLRHFFLNMKEFPEILFYGTMARKSWFIWMGASPFLIILMPLIAVALAGLAALDIYELARASNKNIDKWLAVIVASVCTLLASISISGLVLEKLVGITFAAGPWVFLASVALFGASMVANLGLTLWRLLESPQNSPQQMHFLQRAFSQLNALVTASFIVGCVLGIILFPVSAPLAAVLATGCTLMTVLNVAWRFTPSAYREQIKEFFGVKKADSEALFTKISDATVQDTAVDQNNTMTSAPAFLPRLFTAPDYLSQVKGLDSSRQMDHFEKQLHAYRNRLETSPNKNCASVQSKISLAQKMLGNLNAIKSNKPITTINMRELPGAEQSFWRESEMLKFKQAYDYLVKNYKNPQEEAQINLTT